MIRSKDEIVYIDHKVHLEVDDISIGVMFFMINCCM
jgi:hypothetical protein